jgi:hypothetical protein
MMRRQPGDAGYCKFTDAPLPPLVNIFTGMNAERFSGYKIDRSADDTLQLVGVMACGTRVNIGEPVDRVKPTSRSSWEAPQDRERFFAGDRVCRHCHGSGQYSTDTGFTAGPAVYDCPTCNGAGSL